MHETAINREVVRRVTERRGGLRVFDSIDCKRTAHIIVDLQNGFMAPGQVAEIATARDIVPNVNRISDAVRQAGGLVVYIQNTFDDIAVRT
ncbi:MAG TPA: isochorismatase family protein, partial [Acetobacteraceae bacterium]|nr:isochorismatase family protein [Acetobacteraceae bacterium]